MVKLFKQQLVDRAPLVRWHDDTARDDLSACQFWRHQCLARNEFALHSALLVADSFGQIIACPG